MSEERTRVCIVGASGKLGRYLVQHSLDRGYEVVGVCRAESVAKLVTVPGARHRRSRGDRRPRGDRARGRGVRWRARRARSAWGPRLLDGHGPGGARLRGRGARLVFSCGWHITLDGQDVYSWKLKALVKIFGPIARLARFADLDDQVEACRRVFASDTRWTVVRGSDLEEGESQGLPVWSRHVGDPILESNLTRRVDFALFMVEALTNDELVHEAPAIVGRETASALAHASGS